MRKLPVFAATGHALRSTYNHLPFAFQISWPWMAVLAPLTIIVILLASQVVVAPPMAGTQAIDGAVGPFFGRSVLLLLIPVVVTYVMAMASIAVNWHRYILLDEVPQGWARLRVDALAWRYVGNALIIGLIGAIGLGVLVFSIPAIVSQTGLGLTPLIALLSVAYFVSISITYRLSIKLPAIALDRSDFSLSDAWASSKGNSLQIAGIAFLSLMIGTAAGVVSGLGNFIFAHFGIFGLLISAGFQLFLQWVLIIFSITIFTSLYGFFVEGRDF